MENISTRRWKTLFEQHVDALFLAPALVMGIPPILRDCQVEEVDPQTENFRHHRWEGFKWLQATIYAPWMR